MAGKDTKKGFYADALSESESRRLSEARSIEGLDEEIALLRVRLSTIIKDQPENTELMLKSVGMLVKAIATRYRLSKKAQDNLADAITSVLREVGGALYPEGFDEI